MAKIFRVGDAHPDFFQGGRAGRLPPCRRPAHQQQLGYETNFLCSLNCIVMPSLHLQRAAKLSIVGGVNWAWVI